MSTQEYQDAYMLERFSKSPEEFDTFYDNELKQVVEELEAERLKLVDPFKKLVKTYWIPVLIAAIAIAIIDFSYLFLILFGLFIFAPVLKKNYKEFNQKRDELAVRLKKEVLARTVRFMHPTFTYMPNHAVSRQEFIDAHIFADEFSTYKGDDYMTGAIGDDEQSTKVQLSEVSAERVMVSRDREGNVTRKAYSVFQGLFFVADFNKDFQGLTTVVPKEKEKSFLAQLFTKEDEAVLRPVETMDLTFDETFTVKSSDEIKARYILTPAFMKRLLDFSQKQRKNKVNQGAVTMDTLKDSVDMLVNRNRSRITTEKAFIVPLEHAKSYFSFLDGKMYFMLHTGRKHFEFALHQPIDKELFTEYYEDINRAMELVDELNLNLRIWNKE
ncbi:DUF3137 domain-containing protein [Alkalicoccobacillus plakortidis]|uniref:DUF3137 domain-containing protein n=1 Tax=Alkalicoccobacillus plakortidis TaxID=444060 RepID=A0ABT0XQH1_9BACI|nr:DUF3137 domain-containing protein [Alkalicoccobacillus plakortidis]MCM2678025.1 DUF3137 domain-containing protein [Alkalicoccobacillus plakortidis]